MKTPTITSGFALLDVKDGREELMKLCESSHKVPVEIKGWIVQGGLDDGVSREFSVTVDSVTLGAPVYVSQDNCGRAWAVLSEVKEGDILECDGGFGCLPYRARLQVRRDPTREADALYVDCKGGHHYLDGQLGYGRDRKALIGFYPVRE